ncbi:MAG: helix-turn-helix domain-containing protein [Deltaproteobacteria bacterium]|nr:helix-turn-helix domain-containing protein [Deltaproteobacteria bacterium]
MGVERFSAQQIKDRAMNSSPSSVNTVPELLNYEEAAKLLRFKVPTLYSLVSRKQIPHIRLSGRSVRFDRDVLLQWLAERAFHPGKTAN